MVIHLTDVSEGRAWDEWKGEKWLASSEGTEVSTAARAIYMQLDSIRKHAANIRSQVSIIFVPRDEILSLWTEYEDAKNSFMSAVDWGEKRLYLRPIDKPPQVLFWGKARALLYEMEIECAKGIGALDSLTSKLPKDLLDKLTSLRSELGKLSSVLVDLDFETNVAQAIEEYENGHLLASALISSRVVVYALDKVPGQRDEDKIKFLHEKDIIDPKRKDISESILKTSRKARNFFSHDIKVFPSSADALSLLGDTIAILRIIAKLEEASKS